MASPEKPRARASRDGSRLEPIEARKAIVEVPSDISEEVRSQWTETRMDGDTLALLDADGNTIETIPFSEVNMRHFMGGPEHNAAVEDARAIEQLNEQRRAQGKPDLVSLEQIEVEEQAARAQQRRVGPNRVYSPKYTDRLQHNMRYRLNEEVVASEAEKAEIEAVIAGIHDSDTARAAKARLDALPVRDNAKPRPRRERAPEPTKDSASDTVPAVIEEPVTQPEPVREPAPNLTKIKGELRIHANALLGTGAISRETFSHTLDKIEHAKDTADTDEISESLSNAARDRMNAATMHEAPAVEQEKAEHAPVQEPIEAMRAREAKRRSKIEHAVGGGIEFRKRGSKSEPVTPKEEAAQTRATAPKERSINRRNIVGLEPMTVRDILSDPKHQQFFGELIHSLEPVAGHDIMQRYNRDELTTEDMSFFNYAATEYTVRDRIWSELASHLDMQDVEDFKRRNKSLDNIIGFIGKDGALDTLKSTLRHTAMTNIDAFTQIEHAVHHAHSVRASRLGKKSQRRIDALSASLGIPSDQFVDVFDFTNKDPKAMREARERAHKYIVARVQKDAGGTRKVMDWIYDKTGIPLAGASVNKADRILLAADEALRGRFGATGKKLDALGRHLDHAAPALTAVLGSADIREKVIKESKTGERHQLGIELGPTSYAEMQKEAATMKEADMQRMIEQRIKKEGAKWHSGGASYQDSVLQDMKKKTLEKTLGGGFYAWLLAIIFGSKFDKAAARAKHAVQEH